MISSPRKFALLALLTALFLYTGCSEEPSLVQPDPTTPTQPGKAIPAGYYDSVDTSTPAAMRTSLHAVIDDHTKIPYTSDSTDTWNVLELADQDPNDSSRILDVYLNASYPKYGAGNLDYNREHTWPKSYGFPDDLAGNYPYTDCHHLFLCNDSYNTSRSNKPYRYGSSADLEKPTEVNDGMGGGTGFYPGNSNWTSGSYTDGTWETWIGRRGDVARALLYMDVRYEGGVHGVTGYSEPDLILTDDEALILASNTGSMESVAYMGMLSVLLEWHVQDPVDAREMARNDAVYSFQGNRNPFIDHPEWVDCIFAGTCGGSSGGDPVAWINEFHYDNDGTDTGEFFEIAGTAGLSLTGWTVYGYNGNGGTVYDTEVLSGTLPDQQGGFGTLSFAMVGMQNGSPDGLALVDDSGVVVQFITYEGVIVATDGPAAGLTSVDVGVSETSVAPIGSSLQLGGSGAAYADFTWQGSQTDTPGAVNTGQTFVGSADITPPAEPTGLTATAGDGTVDLDWANNGESDLAGYTVYRSTVSGGSYTALNGSLLTGSTYTDNAVSNGTTYYYVVTASDDSGNESGYGSEASALPTAPGGGEVAVWINELHYDNDGTDTGESFEIAGPAGTSLSGWSVVAYNGNGGVVYDTENLSGTLPDQMGGYGTLSFPMVGMQNGSPDGLALVDDSGTVVLFITYEGVIVATDGPALGLTSEDIGVAEASDSAVGYSLQLGGAGTTYADFTWQGSAANTFGAVNTGQTLGDGTTAPPPASGWTTITYDDFEGGMGNYTDGGGDMELYVYGTYAHDGSNAADIQDNSGEASSFYHASGHDVSGYTDLEVEFWYYPLSMDRTGEDFWVQYWDGTAWQTVAVFDKGIDFENGAFYNAVVSIPAGTYDYPADARLRFMCDASGNRDDVYIDEVEFRGFN